MESLIHSELPYINCVANDVYDYDAVDNDKVCVRRGRDQRVLPKVKRGAGGLAPIRRRGNCFAGGRFNLL